MERRGLLTIRVSQLMRVGADGAAKMRAAVDGAERQARTKATSGCASAA